MGGDTEDAHPPAGVLDDEERVEPVRQAVEKPVEDQAEQAQRHAHDLARPLDIADQCRSGARARLREAHMHTAHPTCAMTMIISSICATS